LADLAQLTEMGYPRDLCLHALYQVGHDLPAAVHLLSTLPTRGGAVTPPVTSPTGTAPSAFSTTTPPPNPPFPVALAVATPIAAPVKRV
jgi:hypothetical protein